MDPGLYMRKGVGAPLTFYRLSAVCQPTMLGLGEFFRTLKNVREFGRDGGIRTYDPLTPSQVRYQAALHPVFEDP